MIEETVMELLRRVSPLGDHPVRIVAATEEEMRTFEHVHDLILPWEIKSWFRHCNGASVNPGGLISLFSKDDIVCLDWYFKQYPDWKGKGWFPLASDGCGDLYIMTMQITISSTRTHPVCFLDQSDFARPQYVVASGVWRFLYLLLENEIRGMQGMEAHWPFDKEAVLAVDPDLAECRGLPLPWEIDVE